MLFMRFYSGVLPKAGYTGISVGKVDERYVMLPIHSIVDKGARKAGTEMTGHRWTSKSVIASHAWRWTCKAESSSACWTPLDSPAWHHEAPMKGWGWVHEIARSCVLGVPLFSRVRLPRVCVCVCVCAQWFYVHDCPGHSGAPVLRHQHTRVLRRLVR